MSTSCSKPLPALLMLIPVLIATVLYSYKITSTDLWTPDEPRYALVAREMIESGDFINPQINGEPYAEKPPLFFWAVAAGAKLFGSVDSFTTRLPSIISAFGTIILLVVFLDRYLGRRTAVIAGCILATSPLFFWHARSGHIDLLLTFLLTASLTSFYRWHKSRDSRHLAVFYGGIALAMLAKGPVALLLPLLVVIMFLLLQKQAGELKRMLPHIALPIALAPLVVWYLLAKQDTSGLEAGSVVSRQVFMRLFGGGGHSVSVWYWPFYHLLSLAWGMAPWSLLLPFAVAWAWKMRENEPLTFMFCWSAAIFGFFTLIASKRELYLLPMYPAAAALAGQWMRPVQRAEGSQADPTDHACVGGGAPAGHDRGCCRGTLFSEKGIS